MIIMNSANSRLVKKLRRGGMKRLTPSARSTNGTPQIEAHPAVITGDSYDDDAKYTTLYVLLDTPCAAGA